MLQQKKLIDVYIIFVGDGFPVPLLKSGITGRKPVPYIIITYRYCNTAFYYEKKPLLLFGKNGFELFAKLFSSVNAYLLAILANTLELNSSVDNSKNCVIRTDSNACAGMNVCTSLTNDDVAGSYKLSVSSLNAKSLGLGITSVLSGTHTFFMSKKLHRNSDHCGILPFNLIETVIL